MSQFVNRHLVAVIAPGHKSYDERVRRTVDEFSKQWDVLYIYELDGDPPRVEHSPSGSKIFHRQFPNRGGSGLRARFKKIADLKELLSRHELQCYYIHESGTFGLNIIQSLPGTKTIIFDYHDWIPFEIREKFQNSILFGVIYALTKIYIRKIIKKTDAVVFISNGARDYFNATYAPVRSFVVPNSRDNSFLQNRSVKQVYLDPSHSKVELLWLGNIMRLRQIERVLYIAHHLRQKAPLVDVKISIWGSIKDEKYLEELKKLSIKLGLQKYLDLKGPFLSENDIVLDQSRLGFGLAFGWNESKDTGINLIARPTKFFSYGLLGVVGLLDANCTSFHKELECSGLRVSFKTDVEAAAKIEEFCNNSVKFENTAAELTNFCINESIKSKDSLRALSSYLLSELASSNS